MKRNERNLLCSDVPNNDLTSATNALQVALQKL